MRPHRARAFTLVELIIVIAIIAIIAAIAIPNMLASRKHAQENTAVANLKTIISTQVLFREQDKEADLNFDYATLAELSATTLIDSVLGSGTKSGYIYEVSYGAQTSEFLWYGVANPAAPGSSGDLYFCCNQKGVIFYTFTQAFTLNTTDCLIPSTALPVYSR